MRNGGDEVAHAWEEAKQGLLWLENYAVPSSLADLLADGDVDDFPTLTLEYVDLVLNAGKKKFEYPPVVAVHITDLGDLLWWVIKIDTPAIDVDLSNPPYTILPHKTVNHSTRTRWSNYDPDRSYPVTLMTPEQFATFKNAGKLSGSSKLMIPSDPTDSSFKCDRSRRKRNARISKTKERIDPKSAANCTRIWDVDKYGELNGHRQKGSKLEYDHIPSAATLRRKKHPQNYSKLTTIRKTQSRTTASP
ncbi:hypothetical protein HDV00_000639 [Rhizophlyctis rosea]|nr:hypothetical protein HDV00_000639 [Rhizophlyctis rosea]